MDLHQRKQIRLKGYDYSEIGHYFVTICTFGRELLFGKIVNGKMILNQYGEIVQKYLKLLGNRFPINLDIFQIMPNHLHFVLIINSNVGVHHDAPLQRTKRGDKRALLSIIIGYLKMNTTKTIGMNNKIWQRNYYEHIIRNEKELFEIHEYIRLNPIMWEKDQDNPKNIK